MVLVVPAGLSGTVKKVGAGARRGENLEDFAGFCLKFAALGSALQELIAISSVLVRPSWFTLEEQNPLYDCHGSVCLCSRCTWQSRVQRGEV